MLARLLAIALVFVVLTFVFALPLSLHPATEALDLGPDTRLFLWTLAWDVHALVRQPLAIFDANIFYPESRTLAYSEHQIGSALFAAPVIAAGGNPLLAMNLVVLFACALSGLGAFFLARELGLGWYGALVCGIVFTLTPPRFFRLGQLHLATVQWIPFCLALLHRYARGGTTRHLVGAGLLFTLQAWSGGQSGLFLALAASALGLYLLVLGEVKPGSRLPVDFAGTTLVVLALNIPFLLPYLRVQQELGLERSLQEAIVWSPNAESFIASPTHVDRWALRVLGWEDHVRREAKAYLFPGLLPLVLAIFAFVPIRHGTRAPPTGPLLDLIILALVVIAIGIELAGGIRIGGFSASGGGRTLVLAIVLLAVRFAIYRRAAFTTGAKGYRAWWKTWTERRIGVAAGFYLWLGAFSLWASLGPPASLYTALYRVVPGFDFIRVPSRLTLLTVLALSVLAGFGAELVTTKWKRLASRWLPGVLVVLVLVELAAFPLETTHYRVTTSPMDQWLAEESTSDPIVVLPIPDPRDDVASARRHSTYMLYSLAHFAPLVNGYSGFTPQSHERLFQRLARFPDDDGLAELEKLGVRFAVFHRNGYADREWEALVQRAEALADGLGLLLVASFDEGRVYELSRSRRGS